MNAKRHLNLFVQGVAAWLIFWLLGLPDYYQQYSAAAVGAGSVVLSVLISLLAVWVLRRGRDETRVQRAIWISFYYTVPLALLDTWYCGIYLGHGAAYLVKYWYLSIFYITPWLTFVPTAWLLSKPAQKPPR
jgi:hypothetical protein